MKVIFFPLLLLGFLWSCAKETAERSSTSQDSLKVAQQMDSVLQEAMRLGDTTVRPEPLPGSTEVPIGKYPLLHSSVLAQFHPNPQGFQRYRSLAYDSSFVRSESVSFFKANNDTTRILRCIIVDQNEQTASTLIKQIMDVKAPGYKDFDIDGGTMRVFYMEINGVPAVHGYNHVKKVATLNILCGDHRLVLFREDNVESTGHLISVAKTMDLQRLSEMVPQ